MNPQLVSLALILFHMLAASSMAAEPAADELDAQRLLDAVRIELAGGRDVLPERIEIDAVYHYAGDERMIVDHTVIEPGKLFQEREIDGRTIRRGWQDGGGFLEGPDGRIDLEGSMSDDLESYLCLRQLELGILCPGARASLRAEPAGDHRVIEVHRGGRLLAELEIDLDARRLDAVRYPQSVTEPADEGAEGTAVVEYSEYRSVEGGWTLPHRVTMRVDGEPRSSYSVERWKLAGE